MTFYEKYKDRLDWGWTLILLVAFPVGLIILVWRDEIIEMLNEIKVEPKDESN